MWPKTSFLRMGHQQKLLPTQSHQVAQPWKLSRADCPTTQRRKINITDTCQPSTKRNSNCCDFSLLPQRSPSKRPWWLLSGTPYNQHDHPQSGCQRIITNTNKNYLVIL